MTSWPLRHHAGFPALLRLGNNVLAVEIHQNSRNSSDLVFDLQLIGAPPRPFSLRNVAVQIGDGGIKIVWPDTPNQWQLYALPGLDATNIWTPVTILPNLLMDQRIITLPVAGAAILPARLAVKAGSTEHGIHPGPRVPGCKPASESLG